MNVSEDGISYKIDGCSFIDMPTLSEGSAVNFLFSSGNLSIIGSLFVDCSSTLNAGACFINAKYLLISTCLFKRCRTEERGACIKTDTDIFDMQHISADKSYVGVCGSFYFLRAISTVRHINESRSYTPSFSTCTYPQGITGSVMEYIGLYQSTGGRGTLGWSGKMTCDFRKIVINDCTQCESVFYLYETSITIEDVYLWNVNKKLLYYINQRNDCILTIRNLYSNINFGNQVNVTVLKTSGLMNIPKAEISLFPLKPSLACPKRVNIGVTMMFCVFLVKTNPSSDID